MIAALLLAAASLVGSTPGQLGLPAQFWCQDFVAHVIADAGQTGGGWSPPATLASLVPFEPTPGGIVGINAVPAGQPDFPIHVAIIEAVLPGGAVAVIEGNGASETEVTRNVYQPEQIAGSAVTPEVHGEYLDGLCADLQEAKPWVDWGC